MDPSFTLRELFARSGIIRLVGAHNAMGAKLAERAGFDGIWASGFEISASYAVPDADILTMSEYLAAAQAMTAAVNIPVIADCDTGFGNSSNVIHMVKRYESAKVAAVCIEDKHFPKINSFIPERQELVPIAEFVGKIMAAKNAQRSKDFMVIARVEALIAGRGQEEAQKRARAYVKAGADAILIHSKDVKIDEIAQFAKSWDSEAPLIVVPTTYYNITISELESLGIKMVIYANHGIRAAIKAMEKAFEEILQTGSSASIEPNIAPKELVFDLQGMPKLKEDEDLFLHPRHPRTRAIIPAAGDHLDELSMKHIAADIPITMLDINGKSLLQLQLNVLTNSGIRDISVIGGYKKEYIKTDGIKLIVNPEWESAGIAHSISCDKRDLDGRVLIVFSDILFTPDTLGKLLDSEREITILVDKTFTPQEHESAKNVTLIQVFDPSPTNRRALSTGDYHHVSAIGKKLRRDSAHYEFAGLVLFSKSGFNLFRTTYERVFANLKDQPFHEAASVHTASFTDVLQELIENGHEIHCMEVSSGWMEIHSFEDYKQACMLLAGKSNLL
jgi:phosphoenolpyruvate phosphomutase